jgi:hypothetical protein
MLGDDSAVMKIVEIAYPWRINSRCSSGPDVPGILMSRIRHRASATQSEARNSFADANALAAKPSTFRRSGSDSLTDSSSSITATKSRCSITRFPKAEPIQPLVDHCERLLRPRRAYIVGSIRGSSMPRSASVVLIPWYEFVARRRRDMNFERTIAAA